jgi:hypothetical protein
VVGSVSIVRHAEAVEQRVFTVAGGTSTQTAGAGAVATAVTLNAGAVLGLPGDEFLFYDRDLNRVVRVDVRGRLHAFAGNGGLGESGDGRRAVDARLWEATDLALHPDGVLIGDSIAGTIRLVRRDGVIVRLAGGGLEEPSEGLPSSRAELGHSVAATPAGELLAVEEDRIWRIGPDGVMHLFAGGGSGGDGSPATTADLSGATSIAVGGDGSVYVSQPDRHLLRRIGPDGVVRTIAQPFHAGRIALHPAGVLCAIEFESGRVAVSVAHFDGTITPLAGGFFSGFDGDGGRALDADLSRPGPLSFVSDIPDVSAAADGGTLIGGGGAVRYLPPHRPGLFAIAIRRPTLTPHRRLRAAFALTRAATVVLEAKGGHGIVATIVRRGLAAGDHSLTIERPLDAGAYVLRIVARSRSGQLASDRQTVFLGGLLPQRQARAVTRRSGLRAFEPPYRAGRCRRFTRARVDCTLVADGTCLDVVRVRLAHDGLLYALSYGVIGGRCKFKRHPGSPNGPEYPAAPL